LDQLTLHWSDTPIILESHTGPTPGAIWVILPDEKIVFVGDAVLKSQPPFLAHADLPSWIETLKILQEPEYKGFTIVSGRGGVVTSQAVRNQIEVLKRINEKVEKIGKKKTTANVTDKLADQLLKSFRAPAARQKQYSHRLRYGLHHYYLRHYQPSSRLSVEE
jgi:glyoxylase-like metal-dependent hydrolase (beta-lactamase superfamily II)